MNSDLNCVKAFIAKYNREPDFVKFTPYRICPVGAHVDHNLGQITGFAIDKGIYIACGAKRNGVIEISSLQFDKRAQWHVLSTPKEKQDDWADHIRGATLAIAKRFPLTTGLCAVIDGELPIGGLSSSAAVIITFMRALCNLNNISLTSQDLINLSREAENKYVGVSCGKLDQSCEIYCKKDKLLYMDIQNDFHKVLQAGKNMKNFEFIIFFSGLERSLASSKYNMRVDELRCAAYCLKAFEGLPYGRFSETNMREVPYEVFEKYQNRLPENFRKRAKHFYTENFRVERAVAAWENGDIQEFGRLVYESGKSSIEDWQTGSEELITLYNILTKTDGVYGARFSGAGFKGCCLAIVNPEYESQILERVKEKYLEIFPNLSEKYSAHVCHTADGVEN